MLQEGFELLANASKIAALDRLAAIQSDVWHSRRPAKSPNPFVTRRRSRYVWNGLQNCLSQTISINANWKMVPRRGSIILTSRARRAMQHLHALHPEFAWPALLRERAAHYQAPPANLTEGGANLTTLSTTAQFYRQDALTGADLTTLGLT